MRRQLLGHVICRSVFFSFIDLPGQVADGEAPDGPDAVVLTQSVLEGRGRLGGDRHLGDRDRGRGKDSGAGLNGGAAADALRDLLSLSYQYCSSGPAGGGGGTPNRTSEEKTMQTRKKKTSANATHGMKRYSISTHSDSGCPLFVT